MDTLTSKKASKAPKEPKAPKKKMNVPPSNTKITSLPWTIHIYNMIKSANPSLLTQDNVIDAYNNLIECLTKYNTQISTYKPYHYQKYSHGIILTNKMNVLCWNVYRKEDIVEEIYTIYMKLYELIQTDVVPYMKKMESNKKIEQERKVCIRKLAYLQETQIFRTEQHMQYVAIFDKKMKTLEVEIADIVQKLEELNVKN